MNDAIRNKAIITLDRIIAQAQAAKEQLGLPDALRSGNGFRVCNTWMENPGLPFYFGDFYCVDTTTLGQIENVNPVRRDAVARALGAAMATGMQETYGPGQWRWISGDPGMPVRTGLNVYTDEIIRQRTQELRGLAALAPQLPADPIDVGQETVFLPRDPEQGPPF